MVAFGTLQFMGKVVARYTLLLNAQLAFLLAHTWSGVLLFVLLVRICTLMLMGLTSFQFFYLPSCGIYGLLGSNFFGYGGSGGLSFI